MIAVFHYNYFFQDLYQSIFQSIYKYCGIQKEHFAEIHVSFLHQCHVWYPFLISFVKRVNILGDGPLAFIVVWTLSCKMNCICKMIACRRPVGSLDSACQNKTTLSSNTGAWVPSECFIFLLLGQYLHKCKQGKICN